MRRLFKIDPALFTKGQWEEMFNATDLVPVEFHDRAVPVRRGEGSILAAINGLITLRGRIQLGLLGPENHRGENRKWMRDLDGAADVLRGILESERCRRCRRQYPAAGDGLDGLCPGCADREEGKRK